MVKLPVTAWSVSLSFDLITSIYKDPIGFVKMGELRKKPHHHYTFLVNQVAILSCCCFFLLVRRQFCQRQRSGQLIVIIRTDATRAPGVITFPKFRGTV